MTSHDVYLHAVKGTVVATLHVEIVDVQVHGHVRIHRDVPQAEGVVIVGVGIVG